MALGGTAVGLVGNSGQIFAEDFRNSAEEKEEKVANLQRFVDWLDVSKSEFKRLCDNSEVALNDIAEQGAGNLEEDVYFTASRVGRVRGPVGDSLLSSRSEKILAVSEWNYFMGNFFNFSKKGCFGHWRISFDEMKDYLQELKNDPFLLKSIRFKK